MNAADAVAQQAGFIDAKGRREFIRFAFACLFASLLNAHVALLTVVFIQAGHSLKTAGLLYSLFVIPVLIVNLLAGAVAARIGGLATTRLAMSLMIVGFGSLALTAGDFWGALVSRVIHGLGFGLYLPSIMTYGQSRLNQARFVALVIIFTSVIPFSYAFGPAMGEFTLAQFGPTGFFLGGTAPALLGLLMTIGLRPLARPDTKGFDLSGALQPHFVLPLLGLFTCGVLHAYSMAFLPPDLVERGVALALFFIPSTIATGLTRVSGSFFQRFQPRALVACGVSLMAFGLSVLALTSDVLPVIGGALAFGLGSSVIYPVVSAWLSQGIAPERRAGAQAVGAACFYLGLYGSPFPVAFLVEPAGYQATSLTLGLLAVIVAVLLACFGRKT